MITHTYSYSISNYFRDNIMNLKQEFEQEQKNKIPYYRRYEKNVGKLK